MKKYLLCLMATILLLGITTTASAISLSEKEDIYRAESYLYKNSIDKNTAVLWLCENDNFIYPKQANIKDEDYLNYICNGMLDSVDLIEAVIKKDFSTLFEQHGEYREAMQGILAALADNPDFKSVEQIESEKRVTAVYDYVMAAKKFCSNTTKYNKLYDNLLSDKVYAICNNYISVSTEDIVGQICIDLEKKDKGLSNDMSKMLVEFTDSADFAEFINERMDDIGLVADVLEIAKFSYDAFIKLESYEQYDRQYIDFLKYLYRSSNSLDVVTVAGEMLTKVTAGYEANYKEAVKSCYLKIVEDGTQKTAAEISKELNNIFLKKLGMNSIFSSINLSISVGKIFADYWNNTSDIRDILTEIQVYDEIGNILSAAVAKKMVAYENFFGSYEGKAEVANDLIYYTRLLLQVRKSGETAFYNLKKTAYDANAASFLYLFGIAQHDLAAIDSWYQNQTSDFELAERLLFGEIESSLYKNLYEYPEQNEDFVIVDGKLIAYNGSNGSPCVPYDVHTIGTEAFNAKALMTQLTIRGKTMETHCVANCGSLYELFIPKSVTDMQEEAIYNCPNVTIYGYKGTAAETYAKSNNIPFYSLGETSAGYDDGIYVNDYTLSEGSLDLDGKTMYVGGDFLHTGGTLNIGSGKLVIFGDYNMTNFDKSDCSYGNLKMSDENGYLLVYGDFTIDNENYSPYNTFRDGTIELKGDFTQKSTNTYRNNSVSNFNAYNNHKVILSGTGEQIISFEDPGSSYFHILVNKNPNGVIFATDYRYSDLQTIYPFDFKVVEYNTETNQINVDIIVSEDLQTLNGTVIISLYDENNKLIECRIKELSELEPQTFNVLNDYYGKYIVKAFYWSDISLIKPLWSSIRKELTSK